MKQRSPKRYFAATIRLADSNTSAIELAAAAPANPNRGINSTQRIKLMAKDAA
jgi:hypothetical protein